MRLYPDVPSQRAATLARDAVVLGLLVLFAWFAVQVHDAVDELAVLGEGVREAGASVQGGFETAADAVGGPPVLGDDLADGLREAGEGTGGNVEEVGREGEQRAHDLADLLGALTFAVPALLLLLQFLPQRVGQVRRLTAAARVLRGGDGDRDRLLAMRAASAEARARGCARGEPGKRLGGERDGQADVGGVARQRAVERPDRGSEALG